MRIASLFGKSTADRYLGIDIGHDNLKVVEAELGRDSIRLLNAGMSPTPLHAVAEGQVVMPEVVAEALRTLILQKGISARQCIGSVTGSSVFLRPVSVPRQKPAELAKSIVFEAQKHVSAMPDESYFDATILPDPIDEEPGPEMAALLVVAPRMLVDGRVTAMELAGLDPIAMDVNALAATRVLIASRPDMPATDPAPTIAFVDLGASYTEVTIVQGYVPVFSRTINIGGTSLTNALAGVIGVGFDEAQAIKHGLDAEGGDEGGLEATASRVIHSMLEELVRDIRRSLAYHASTLGWESIEGLVDRVILVGGGSQLIHTSDYFANVLQMNVEIGDLPAAGHIAVAEAARGSMGRWTPSYLTALGLALWPLYASGKR